MSARPLYLNKAMEVTASALLYTVPALLYFNKESPLSGYRCISAIAQWAEVVIPNFSPNPRLSPKTSAFLGEKHQPV